MTADRDAPMPPVFMHSSTISTRRVFFTDAAIVAMSKGFRLMRSMTCDEGRGGRSFLLATYTYTYKYLLTRVHTHTHAHTQPHTHTPIHTMYTHTYIHTRTHTHVPAQAHPGAAV